MKHYYVYNKQTNEISHQVTVATSDHYEHLSETETEIFIDGEFLPADFAIHHWSGIYIADGEINSREDKPSQGHTWDASARAWVIPLETLKVQISDDIRKMCRTVILRGFSSSALGSDYKYPSKELDQQNLNSFVVTSMLESDPEWVAPFWCADASDVWELRMHTAAQIQQVARDARAYITEQSAKNARLQAAIISATTKEELDAIVW